MAKNLCFVLILALVGAQQFCLAAEVQSVRLRWADAGNLIAGRQVAVKTIDGATHKGRIRSVSADSLSFENPKAQPVGRAEVAEIRLTDYVGNGRHRGKFIGGAAGLLFGLMGMAVIGLREGSANSTRDKVLATVMGVGGFPAGLLLGYLLGRQVDKEVTIIRIIPE